MKATGIVRRIDELGRVVIPKEIRRTLRIREGDPLEIYTDKDGEVILKKYSPIGELEDFAKEYADSLYQAIGHICIITDKENIIAVSGAPRGIYLNKPLHASFENFIEERKSHLANMKDGDNILPVIEAEADTSEYAAEVIVPVNNGGDIIGAVVILSKDDNVKMGITELKLAETAAGFVGRQLQN